MEIWILIQTNIKNAILEKRAKKTYKPYENRK